MSKKNKNSKENLEVDEAKDISSSSSSSSKKRVFNFANYAPKIKVIGVGGGGGNAVSRMCEDIGIRGIEFIAINTAAQDLDYSKAKKKLYIGKNLTRGLGTGMNPDLGRQAAEESRAEIVEAVKGADIVFLTIGGGGGTGSGASPVVAEICKEAGALTVAVVTKPFNFEGSQRIKIANEAINRLKDKVDTIVIVPNDRIFSIIKKDTPLVKAFEFIDEVLRSAVLGISELISMPGIINLDFSDIRAIMKEAGPALVGIGIASGQNRASAAVNQVLKSPLLEINADGAKGVLFGVAGNRDLKMAEINEIAENIATVVDPSAKIIFGAYNDKKLNKGQIKVTLIATNFTGQSLRNLESSSQPLFEEQKLGVFGKSISSMDPENKKEKTINIPLDKKEDKKMPEPKKEDSFLDIPSFLRKKKE